MGKKLVLLFMIICWLPPAYSQNPFKENTAWGINQGMDDIFDEVALWPIDSNDYKMETAYNRIHFQPGNKFYAYNIPGCGMDCVMRFWGTYTATDTTLQLIIEKSIGFKRCNGIETAGKDLGIYYIVKDAYSLRLVKNFDDEPKENYFANQQKEVPGFKDSTVKALVAKYEYLYNRASQVVLNNNQQKYKLLLDKAFQWRQAALTYAGSKKENKAFHLLALQWSDELMQLCRKIAPDQ